MSIVCSGCHAVLSSPPTRVHDVTTLKTATDIIAVKDLNLISSTYNFLVLPSMILIKKLVVSSASHEIFGILWNQIIHRPCD